MASAGAGIKGDFIGLGGVNLGVVWWWGMGASGLLIVRGYPPIESCVGVST